MKLWNNWSEGLMVCRFVRIAFWGLVGVCLAVGVLAGCAGVEPYEREYLADPIMKVEEGLEGVYDQHMYRALQGGLSGQPAAGGGCGCEQ